ncbi:trypsin beta [Drosophila teissieri]|uniref:trypsin beta n=1 Tax=Drosophila teissieri TaxID=7243 RepID=UPI001CB9DE13|nr:trypsin beta [Drosophila teissieri]
MSLKLILSLSIAGLVWSAAQIPGPEERIVGGYYIPIEYVPWQVSVLNETIHNCGGAIYSDRAILTAAHCVANGSIIAKDLSVRAGSSHWSKGGQVQTVLKAIPHPKYLYSKGFYDVAVLILEAPLQLGSAVQKISLAEETPTDGTVALASGWGYTQYNSGFQWPILHGVHVTIINRTECEETYRDLPGTYEVTNDMICADGHGGDACADDSGGPLVDMRIRKLVGIVSWGKDCGKYPGVYADVAFFRNWIKRTVQENI